MNVNLCILAGFITRDPELSYTPKGTACCNFGLAVNRSWKDDSGEQRSEVTFLDLQAWGRTAETIAEHFRKGAPIYVQSRAKLEQWDDKQTGQKRSRMRFIVESFQFPERKGEGQGEGQSGGQRQPAPRPSRTAPSRAAAAPDSYDQPPSDDDVPF